MSASKYTIENLLKNGLISNCDENHWKPLLNPASLDVTLGDTILIVNKNLNPYKNYDEWTIKSWEDDNSKFFNTVSIKDSYITLNPSEFILANTFEQFNIPLNYAATFMLKSRLGRVGLDHQLAGWIDPGFKGTVTLELVNSFPYPIRLKAGQRIGQLKFEKLDIELQEKDGYNGNYQNFNCPKAARSFSE